MCMDYLPTFPLECGHVSPFMSFHVGRYSLHGAFGYGKWFVDAGQINPPEASGASRLKQGDSHFQRISPIWDGWGAEKIYECA